jgi:hypothetical protein
MSVKDPLLHHAAVNSSKLALYHQFLGSGLLQNILFIITAVRSNPTVFMSYKMLKTVA